MKRAGAALVRSVGSAPVGVPLKEKARDGQIDRTKPTQTAYETSGAAADLFSDYRSPRVVRLIRRLRSVPSCSVLIRPASSVCS